MVINICSRSKYCIEGEENFVLIQDGEKVAVNPIFVTRVAELYETLRLNDPDVLFAARVPEVAAILIAARVPWVPKYTPRPV